MKSKSVTGSSQSKGKKLAQSEEAQAQNVPRPEEIRQRAYEIHIERGGGAHGQEMDDWLQAERELEAKYRTG